MADDEALRLVARLLLTTKLLGQTFKYYISRCALFDFSVVSLHIVRVFVVTNYSSASRHSLPNLLNIEHSTTNSPNIALGLLASFGRY